MTTNKVLPFKVIKGGLSESFSDSRKNFISAYVTDTRLMGVIGVYAHWQLPDNEVHTDFHQLFYFDAEEFGFDTYKSILTGPNGEGREELENIENSLIGGLGGQKIEITERELRYLLQEYVQMNQKLNLEMPEKEHEYEFLLKPMVELSTEEYNILMKKQCPSLVSEYQVINYFLMRIFGKDFTAAKFLTKNYVRTNIFTEHKAATFYRNNIEPSSNVGSGTNTDYHVTDNDKAFGTFSTHKSYMCESIIEYDGTYHLVVTQVTLDHLRVVKFEKISSFKISQAEAAMMLNRPEYVNVYDLYEDAPPFTQNSTELTKKSMITMHDNGCLFMVFYPHNNHVDKQTFLLNGDVLGVYYVSDSGQVIISSFSEEGIHQLEQDFIMSEQSQHSELISRYMFDEPVLYEFVSSNFEDFEDFAMLINADPDDE